MSIVACKVTKTGFNIAADSITVRGYTQMKGQIGSPKLFRLNGVIIGAVGESYEISLLRIFAASHRLLYANESAILDYLSEFSNWKRTKTGKGDIENAYFIGRDGKVFSIESWLIQKVEKYEAIGAGMDFSLAALHLGHTVEQAVKTAIELSIYCEPPIISMSDNSLK